MGGGCKDMAFVLGQHTFDFVRNVAMGGARPPDPFAVGAVLPQLRRATGSDLSSAALCGPSRRHSLRSLGAGDETSATLEALWPASGRRPVACDRASCFGARTVPGCADNPKPPGGG